MSYARSQSGQQPPQGTAGVPPPPPNAAHTPQQQRIVGPPPAAGPPGMSHRLNELLEGIQQEFVHVSSEASAMMMQKDNFDQKLLTQHMNELTQVRKIIYELDLAHRQMKERYEEEIHRLRQKLDARNPGVTTSVPGQGSGAAPIQPQTPQVASQVGQFSTQPSMGVSTAPPHGASLQLSSQSLPQPAAHQQVQVQGGSVPAVPNPNAPLHAQLEAGTGSTGPGNPYSQLREVPRESNIVAPVQPHAPQPPPQPQAPQPPLTQAPMIDANTMQEEDIEAKAAELGNNLAFLDVEKVPAKYKKAGDDYTVVYNKKAAPSIDVELVQSMKHTSVVCCVRFSMDGRYLATGCNRCAQIFDVATGELLAQLQDKSVSEARDLYIRSVCFSPDAKLLATGAEDHQIRVWDIATKQIKYLFSGHEQDIYSLDFSSNGRYIASGSGDRTLRIWDVETGSTVLSLLISDGVTAVSLSPNGQYVAAGALDRIVRVWEVSTGQLVEHLEGPDGHQDSVYSVAFSPNGLDLWTGSLDKTIKEWHLQAPRGVNPAPHGGVCARTIYGHRDYVLSVAATPDGQWILSGSKDHTVQVWGASSGQAQLMLQAHGNSVISVAPSPTGQLFASGSGDFWAKIWRYRPRS